VFSKLPFVRTSHHYEITMRLKRSGPKRDSTTGESGALGGKILNDTARFLNNERGSFPLLEAERDSKKSSGPVFIQQHIPKS
jgi:hypothetical protein